MRARHWIDPTRWLVYTHRWLGIAGGVLFVAWFVSGIVMMYARMPGLAPEERLARAEPIDLSTAALSPIEAARQALLIDDAPEAAPAAGAPAQAVPSASPFERLRVGMRGGRPVYRFVTGRVETVVYADTGETVEGLSLAEAEALARRYAPGAAAVWLDATITEPDQWTLQARGQMPLHRFAVDDAEATRLYVSEPAGEVVLRTTRRERFWGYLGPVTHWLYFTPLRKNGLAWSEFVIWSSLIGCVMCLTGLVWGLWRFSPRARFRMKRVPSHTPYAGLLKWHHYAGLLFGVVTTTWAYSGLLSMGPFNWFESPGITRAQREVFTGGPLRLEAITLDTLRAATARLGEAFTAEGSPQAVKELELVQFQGEPFWMARRAPAESQATAWMHVGLLPREARPAVPHRFVAALAPASGTFRRFDEPRFASGTLLRLAERAMPGARITDATTLTEYDAHYYESRGERPLPVLRVQYADEARTWLYIDPALGTIVQRTDDTRRLRRWLYQGFHSLDFPAIYYRRPLWDLVVIGLSLGGVVLSATTLLPGFRRLGRRVRAALAWRPAGHAFPTARPLQQRDEPRG